MSELKKVNVAEKFELFSETWSPRLVGQLNGQHIRLAKLSGEFVWHHHENEDELFLVIKGRLSIRLRDEVVELWAGEFLIVPREVEHKPIAHGDVHVLLMEPASTVNTGNVENEMTVDEPERL